MAKRARVKGKGADIFFSETVEEKPEVELTTDHEAELVSENERLRTELEVLRKRIELLEKEIQPLRAENEAMRKRLETYADAFAKLLFQSATGDNTVESLLKQLGIG